MTRIIELARCGYLCGNCDHRYNSDLDAKRKYCYGMKMFIPAPTEKDWVDGFPVWCPLKIKEE